MAAISRLTNRAGWFMALCMSLAITASCSDDEQVDGYAGTHVLSFGVSVSNEWHTTLHARSDAEAPAWNASRFDGGELWIIASSEPNRDTTLFDSPGTRAAAVTTGAFYESFGVYGYAYKGADWESRSNVTTYFDKETATNNNGLWTTGQTRYWPGVSYRMYFFAYAPSDMAALSADNHTPVLEYTVPTDVTKQKDLVVATNDVPGNHNQSVAMPFRHILTAVKVKAAKGMSGTVKKVALKNIKNSGTYTFGENLWTGQGTGNFELVQEVTLDPDAEDGTPVADGEHTFMMIPQTLQPDAVLEVTIAGTDGTETVHRGSLSGKTDWPMGHTVTYRLSKTEINVEYEFSATHPNTFTGEGGSNPMEIRSFKTANGVSRTSVPWENAGYYNKTETGDYTPIVDEAPDWLVFPAYQADLTEYRVKVYQQYGTAMDGTGENSGKTVISPDKILQTMRETGSEAAPVNLAGTEGSETTANCYIVNAPGWYKFPIVYGNALKNGSANAAAYNTSGFVNHLDNPIHAPRLKDNGIAVGSAQLLWQDTPAAAPLIEVSSVQVDGDCIRFHIPAGENCVQGNAVIAVKDADGKIAWSWHIWVTLHKPDATFEFGDNSFFKALLGYREAELVIYPRREVYVKLIQKESEKAVFVPVSQDRLYQFVAAGNAPYYQHGRKDPFPGASLKVERNNGNYSLTVLQDRVAEFNAEPVAETFTLGYAIQHPDTYIGQHTNNINWYWYLDKGFAYNIENGIARETGYKNLWDNGTAKTLYDPCPAGYKIPTFEALKEVSQTDKTDVEYVNTGLYFINNKNQENEQRFFLQILSSRGYSEKYTSKMSTSANANLHCSMSNGGTMGHYLYFNGTDYWLSNGTVCAGRCILPQKE